MVYTVSNTDFPICQKLAEAQIIDLVPDASELGSGKLMVVELCDTYFKEDLTKTEVYQLAVELKRIGDLL